MKAMVGLIFAILIIFGFRLFWPSSEPEINDAAQNEVLNDKKYEQVQTVINASESSTSELGMPSDDEKTKLMTMEYEVLEQARKKLKRHVAQLKHEMWGLKFAPEIAKEISTTVLSASKLLKNPHMLGAFSNVAGIKDEIAKVNFAEKSLEKVDEIIKANKDGESGG